MPVIPTWEVEAGRSEVQIMLCYKVDLRPAWDMGKPISNNNKRICIWLQHWECMERSEHLPSMDQVLASIFSALESNRNCVAHIY